MGDLTKFEDVSAFSDFFALLSADAVVATRPWTRRNEKKLGSFALTRCTLGPGSWMLTGQCSYSVAGASESEFEIKLDLNVWGKDKENPRYYRFSYLHFEGGDFGTATVIGAVTVDEIVSVEL